MKILGKYVSGENKVTIYEDGTKVREKHGVKGAFPYVPENIDVKITNHCDMGCPSCFENSTLKGQHGNIGKLIELYKNMPRGLEIAIGGGNPISHPGIMNALDKLVDGGAIPNMTINQGHFEPYHDEIKHIIDVKMVYGVGVSINKNFDFEWVKKVFNENTIFHVIAGQDNIDILDKLAAEFGKTKVLVLGYKQFGRGLPIYNKLSKEIDKCIWQWSAYIQRYFEKMQLSFDNLAITQLDIRRFFTPQGWDKFYMGDDGLYTMYLDLVEDKFAKSSTQNIRYDIENRSLYQMIDHIRKVEQNANSTVSV